MKSKYFLIVAIAISVTTSSCKKDDENKSSATKNAKVETKNLDNEMSADLVKLLQTDGAEAITDLTHLIGSDFSDILDGTLKENMAKDPQQSLKREARKFKSLFLSNRALKNAKVEIGFDFKSNTGVYEWDPILQDFAKTQSSTIIELKFPTADSDANNAVLRINEYTEAVILGTVEYLPTLISADLTVNGEKIVNLKFNANYDAKGTFSYAIINLNIDTFKFNTHYYKESKSVARLKTIVKNDDEILFDSNLRLEYTNRFLFTLKEVAGYSKYQDYKLTGSINFDELLKAGDGEDINPFVNLVLFEGTEKLGTIQVKYETAETEMGSESKYVAYIKFSDNSTQKVEDVMANTLDQIEKNLVDMEDIKI